MSPRGVNFEIFFKKKISGPFWGTLKTFWTKKFTPKRKKNCPGGDFSPKKSFLVTKKKNWCKIENRKFFEKIRTRAPFELQKI